VGDTLFPAASGGPALLNRPLAWWDMNILIAEDQIPLGRALKEWLRPWGYEATVVHDGLAALAALQAPDGPVLALLDWLMPGLDGIEVCRRVRADASLTYPYLVLVTGQGSREQMLDALEAGADDFLIKPVEAAELRARLATGRRIVTLQEQLLATQRQLREQATRDALTGLWNRAAILDLLERELARGQREGRPVGVILADVDHFKGINDTFGHLAGDRVLRQVAGRLGEALRPYDTVGRYGGEEFLVVLPGCDAAAATGLAERLRRCVAAEPVGWEGGPVAVTLSLGVAAWDGSVDTAGLLQAADEALYRAKGAGRNRVMSGQGQAVARVRSDGGHRDRLAPR
jgi:two-component system cell cycle response regulator